MGLPNSGKSSLMNNLSSSKSDVSMIAGTTLVPHTGHLVYNDQVRIQGMDIKHGLYGLNEDTTRFERYP